MWKRGAVQRAIRELGMESTVSVVLFQQIQKNVNGGFSLQLQMRTGIDFETLEKSAGKIAVAIKYDNVTLIRQKKNRVYLTADNGFSEKVLAFPISPAAQFLPPQIDDYPIGIDVSGLNQSISLFSSKGGTTTLIGGNPGFGKSTLLKILLMNIAPTTTAVFWLDAKFGADASEFASRVEVIDRPDKPLEILEMIKSLNRLIDERNLMKGKGAKIGLLKRVVVFIDEWAVLANAGSKQIQSEMASELKKLVALSRSANLSVVLATQRPTKENVDTTSKELANHRIAFQVMDKYASEAILGFSGAEIGAARLPVGTCIVSSGGKVSLVKVFDLPSDINERVNSHANFKISIDSLLYENQVCAREFGIEL
jgi:ABC-type cobalamin/Fe3+-siderophores transport system ATPase subunit